MVTENRILSFWSQLEDELLEEIMDKLFYADLVRFQAVCKNWSAICQYRKTPSNSLPWFVSIQQIENGILECRFCEPLSSEMIPYSVDKIDLARFGIFPCMWSMDTTCKHGWLFFDIQMLHCKCTWFLLFSPLTKKIIELPTLFHSKDVLVGYVKAFSDKPNSPDCVFLILDNYVSDDQKITIRTFLQGDKEWKTRDFDITYNFMRGSCIPVYIQGIFYFVYVDGEVTSYHISSGEWKVERNLIDDIFHWNIFPIKHSRYEAFELNGELVLVNYCYNYTQRNNGGKSGSVRRFDWSKKVWVPLQNFGDQALFVSRNSFFISAKTRNNGVLANKIYVLVESGCIIYSLKNGDLVNFAKCSGITNWDEANNYNGKLAFWIEPPDYLVKQKKLKYK